MTLRRFLKILRERWITIVASTALAAAVVWFLTPAAAAARPAIASYTATSTLLVNQVASDPNEPAGQGMSLDRLALFIKTGEIPQRAAKKLEYPGEPVVLASQIDVEPDSAAGAITISASDADPQVAADRANTFASEAIAYFKKAGTVNLSVLQKATPLPDDPGGGFVIPPSRPIRAALAGIVGLLIGLALALVFDNLDSRIKSRGDVRRTLGLPVIAEVPKLARRQRAEGIILTRDEPLSPYADAYRAARSALLHVSSLTLSDDVAPRALVDATGAMSGRARTVLVTSAQAGEGKTTSLANLAASLAETGQRVLVLDADLRNPDAHEKFDVPQGAGVSDYLSSPQRVALETVIRPTSIPEVSIVTAGTRLDRPESLTSRMQPLLDAARDHADVVLVDSSPILGASDAFDILPLVDTLVLVVRSGRLTEPEGQRAAELLGRFKVPVTGAILVGAPRRRRDKYGYGYAPGKRAKGTAGSPLVAEPEQPVGPSFVDTALRNSEDSVLDSPTVTAQDAEQPRRAR